MRQEAPPRWSCVDGPQRRWKPSDGQGEEAGVSLYRFYSSHLFGKLISVADGFICAALGLLGVGKDTHFVYVVQF